MRCRGRRPADGVREVTSVEDCASAGLYRAMLRERSICLTYQSFGHVRSRSIGGSLAMLRERPVGLSDLSVIQSRAFPQHKAVSSTLRGYAAGTINLSDLSVIQSREFPQHRWESSYAAGTTGWLSMLRERPVCLTYQSFGHVSSRSIGAGPYSSMRSYTFSSSKTLCSALTACLILSRSMRQVIRISLVVMEIMFIPSSASAVNMRSA
jgi:hypothetical protein